jgi:hypothetical protein
VGGVNFQSRVCVFIYIYTPAADPPVGGVSRQIRARSQANADNRYYVVFRVQYFQ